MRPIASRLGLLLAAALSLPGQAPRRVPVHLLTGRCAQDLPLDAGEGFGGVRLRHLVLRDRICLFEAGGAGEHTRWRLRRVLRQPLPGPAQGLERTRGKWRDGALWVGTGSRVLRLDPASGERILMADPGLEFMDFEVDMTGRILLVGTGDPRTRTYRALLEAVAPDGRSTRILAPYPGPDHPEGGGPPSPAVAATFLAGYEAVQIRECTVLFNPLARKAFVFRPLEDSLQELKLGLPMRSPRELAQGEGLDDLCWQILPRNPSGAWLILGRPADLAALPLDLERGAEGPPLPLPGWTLPVFPDAQGRLAPLDLALASLE